MAFKLKIIIRATTQNVIILQQVENVNILYRLDQSFPNWISGQVLWRL